MPGADWPIAYGFGLVQDQWLCLTYIGAVVLLLAVSPGVDPRGSRLFGLAGRMALTNYMVQAAVLDALASGYGFGLKLRPRVYVAAAVAALRPRGRGEPRVAGALPVRAARVALALVHLCAPAAASACRRSGRARDVASGLLYRRARRFRMSNQRVVLITGASSGVGQATARLLAQQGHKVFGTSRAPTGAEPVANLTMVALDVRSDASVAACVNAVSSQAGRVDVLVNNAGYELGGALEEHSIDEAKAQFETNFFGVVRMTKAVLPLMRRQKEGQIVNISSLSGLRADSVHGHVFRQQVRRGRLHRSAAHGAQAAQHPCLADRARLPQVADDGQAAGGGRTDRGLRAVAATRVQGHSGCRGEGAAPGTGRGDRVEESWPARPHGYATWLEDKRILFRA